MKNVFYLLGFITLMSCNKGAEKFFTDGNYKKAYKQALKDIQSGKKDRTLNTILNNSMAELIADANNESEALLRSDVIEDWDEAYSLNEELLSLYYEGKRYLDSDMNEDIQIIKNNNEQLAKDILTAYVDLGDQNMDEYSANGNKQAAQQAYYMYEGASKYSGSSTGINVRRKLEDALIAGTVFIDVTVDVWDIGYKYEIERQFEDLEDNDERFYEVTFDELNENTDCQLKIEFARLVVNTNTQTRSETYRQEVEDGFETVVDTSGTRTNVPIFREVTAEVRFTDEIRVYTWNIRVESNDRNNYCDFRYNQFQISQEAVISNYQTQGDSRAIPESFRNTRTQTFTSNDERRLIDELIEQSYDEIERYYF